MSIYSSLREEINRGGFHLIDAGKNRPNHEKLF